MKRMPGIICRSAGVLAVVFTLLTAVVPLCAFQQDCLQNVRSVFQKLNFPAEVPSEGRGYFMKFTSVTFMRDTTKVKNVTLTTEMLIYGDIMRVKSSEVEVYQDSKHIVIISPAQRTILIRNYSPVEDQKKAVEKILFLQDTVFNSCTVQHCRSIPGRNGTSEQEVHLELKKGVLSAFPFYALTVVLDPLAQTLKQATVHYSPLQPVRAISVTYHTIDYNYPVPKNITKSALSFVMNGTALLSKYRGYRLVDVR